MPESFFPTAPRTLDEAQVDLSQVEELLLKSLYRLNGATGGRLAKRLCLPATPLREVLAQLKKRNLVVHRSNATLAGDFRYDLSEAGRNEAEAFNRRSAWSGSAPVPLASWLDAIHAQSIRHERVTMDRLETVLRGLAIPRTVRQRLGMAISTGHALFLYGSPGNGKTSVAERITGVVQTPLFIPRVVEAEGNLIRIFDPMVHEPIPESDIPAGPGRADPRWVCCKRPTIIAGGELRHEMLELAFNEHLGLSEASLQLKAAGGTLVIDDFGRQRISSTELLNRWIVPLERRVDFVSLPDGTKLELPFDPFVVFSTNLDPSSLVDEAFLRRIPYKIQLPDISANAFKKLMSYNAKLLKLEFDEGLFDYLRERHYQGRPMRGCHPRDLILQVRDRQAFLGEPMVVTREALDEAAANYFVHMGLV